MARYLVHPVRPEGFSFVPKTDMVAAVVHHEADQGHIDILLPGFGPELENLFEQPIQDDQGNLHPAWSPTAIQFLLETALPRAGWRALPAP